MKHNELIDQLSANLAPVKPAPTPRKLVVMLMAAAVLITSLGVGYWAWRKQEFHVPSGRSLIELFLLLTSATWTAFLAARSVSPSHAFPSYKKMSWLAAGSWLLLLGAAFVATYRKNPTEALVAAHYETWLCPKLIVSIAIPVAVALFLFLRRGALLIPAVTALFLAQTSLVLGAAGLSFICPWNDPLHELLWHVLPVFALTAAVVALTRAYLVVRKRK
jgi:hypothetical protein